MTLRKSFSFFLTLILLAAQFGAAAQIALAQTDAKKTVFTDSAELESRLAKIARIVEERRRELGIPGLALAIVKDDKIIYSKGFGVKDRERNSPVTPDTVFAIASLTKAFTGMATMMTQDDGKLLLDDSPKKFLPFFKLRDAEADVAVTLRDLLSHQTGLGRTDLSLQFTRTLTREEAIKLAGLAKPNAKLREKYQYQNTMYAAAGDAAAKASRTTWENLVETRIFKPLGMNSTNTSIVKMQRSPNFSLGYDYNPETKETRSVQITDLSLLGGAGAINSNARDMAQWVRLMLGGGVYEGKRLISEKSFSELLAPQIKMTPKVGYGLGWFLREWRGKKAIDHSGNIEGFSSMAAMIPEERLGLVMLSNVTGSPLQNEIKEIVWSNLLDQPETNTETKKPAAPAQTIPSGEPVVSQKGISAALREIVGNYENEKSGVPYDVVEVNGAVSIRGGGQPPRLLIEKSRNIFAVEGLPEDFSLTIRRNAAGKVDGLFINQGEIVTTLRNVTIPADAPSIENLMKKVVNAAGGEANLKKHTSLRMEATIDFENEGMTGEAVVSQKAPNLSASNLKYFALGKQIGESFDYFDGRESVSSTTSGERLTGTPYKKSGKFLADARINADFHQPLNWKSLFQKITVKKMAKIGDEAVYVVEKIGENAHPVIDYVSAKSFLVLRRESLQSAGGGDVTVPFVEDFGDYRLTDGVMIPFKISAAIRGSIGSVTTVKSVKFNVDVPDSAFRAPQTSSMTDSKNEQTTKQTSTANPADVATVDSIIVALYEVISGEAGVKRDWNRLRSLFIPEGRMIPINPKKEGGFAPRVLSVDGYIELSGDYIEKNGFFERELSRKTERFGNLVHVFSTYEGKHKLSDEKPFLRGISSFQLMNDGKRWWFIDVVWEAERPDNPLPEKYLQLGKQ